MFEKLITGENPSYFSFMNWYPFPTLWQSLNSHERSRLPKRNIYFLPLWAVQSCHLVYNKGVVMQRQL